MSPIPDPFIPLPSSSYSWSIPADTTTPYEARLWGSPTYNTPLTVLFDFGPNVSPSMRLLRRQMWADDGPLSSDVCDADPNSPEFLRAAATYNARIRAAVGLARDQHEFCPRYTRTEPVLPQQASPTPVVPKLESSPDPDPIKSEPDSDSPSDLVYPSDSSSGDSSPIYAQSIGVATASPSPTPGPSSAEPSEPQSQSPSAPTSSDPLNPFDVNGEPLAPSTVPFLASGQFNPAFVSIRDIARTNPGPRRLELYPIRGNQLQYGTTRPPPKHRNRRRDGRP
ncbi:hypothetical protein Moror_14996 [Moniliophthora roreri MCA 2997]|uniref:Uncharacterized protein n=1 Tax=Moniliophthora roreri (strain MCA 2997) TaxID=1381753 RepID=V2XUV0_MONRO|nr:hypothetical protein Moror_14996 [Moniliophthora roreri MCA 2997]